MLYINSVMTSFKTRLLTNDYYSMEYVQQEVIFSSLNCTPSMQSMYGLTQASEAVPLHLKSLTTISCTSIQETESETSPEQTSVMLAELKLRV